MVGKRRKDHPFCVVEVCGGVFIGARGIYVKYTLHLVYKVFHCVKKPFHYGKQNLHLYLLSF